MSKSNDGWKLGGLVGGTLAAYMSWVKWHSIFWAVIHGFFGGWIYVVYSLIRYGVPK